MRRTGRIGRNASFTAASASSRPAGIQWRHATGSGPGCGHICRASSRAKFLPYPASAEHLQPSASSAEYLQPACAPAESLLPASAPAKYLQPSSSSSAEYLQPACAPAEFLQPGSTEAECIQPGSADPVPAATHAIRRRIRLAQV